MSQRDPKSDESQKRRAPRVVVRRRVDGQREDGRVFGFTRDIGWGGMFVRTADVLEEGAEVDLCVQLHAEGDPVTVHGRVVRVTQEPEKGMAIAFAHGGSEPERQFIASFVREMELQLKIEQLDEAKRKLLDDVRSFQEEKIAIEKQRLAFADAELEQSRTAATLKEEQRKLKREYLDKLQLAEGKVREAEAQVARVQREIGWERDDLARARDALQRERDELTNERQQLLDELKGQKSFNDGERTQLLEEIDRERKLHKQLALRKTAAREQELEGQFIELQQQIASLEHVNELLETKCRDAENRAAIAKSDNAGQMAELHAKIEVLQSRQQEQLNQRRAAETRLQTRIEELQKRLATTESDLEHERQRHIAHDAQRHGELGEAEERIERLNDELDELDSVRAQAVADLDAARQQRTELEVALMEVKLERDEAQIRLELRDSMFEELQQRLTDLESERDGAQQRVADLQAQLSTGSAPPPTTTPTRVELEPEPPIKTVTLHHRVPDTADPDDLQHLGIGRRMSHWVEQVVVRVAPASVDVDEMPKWEKDPDDN